MNGDLQQWIRFFLRGVRHQARDAEERTVRLVELQHRLRSELLDEKRPPSVVRLAEHLFTLPSVTASWAANALGVTPPTAYAAINTLVERGDLIAVPHRARSRMYEASRIFEAVYGPVKPGKTAQQ